MLWLRNQDQWKLVSGLWRSRFANATANLEKADETNFRFEQGRVHEIRNLLELEEQAKAVLEKERTPNGLSVIE